MSGQLRCGVYVDIDYSIDDKGPASDVAFARFLAALGEEVELTVFGRRRPGEVTAANRLSATTRFVELPWYPSLTAIGPVLSTFRSVRQRIGSVRDTDITWVFGPHPLGDVVVRDLLGDGRPVALGVRQHFPAYLRTRADRRLASLAGAAAWGFEASFRRLATRCPVAVVGPALARGYHRSPLLQVLPISLVPSAAIRGAVHEAGWDEPIKVLSVGRLDAEKNPMLLIDVAERLHRHQPGGWIIDIVGDGPLADALEERICTLADPNIVRLNGAVPFAELPARYDDADVFLHASWTEGLPQVLFEAGAAGLPIVATDVGSVRAVFGDAAAIVPPGDAAAAADALVAMAANPTRRVLFARSAHQVAQQHTLESTVTAAVEFLKAAVGRV